VFDKCQFLPRRFALSIDLENIFDLEAVQVVGGGVGVLDVLVDYLEFGRLLVQNFDGAVQLLVVSIDWILAGLVSGLEEAVGDLNLQQVVQHLYLRLDEVGIVEN
jgi:hypothetical protein